MSSNRSPSFNNGYILGNVFYSIITLRKYYVFLLKKTKHYINLRTGKNNAKLLYHASGILFKYTSLCVVYKSYFYKLSNFILPKPFPLPLVFHSIEVA